MDEALLIRPEREGDADTIRAVIDAAFRGMPYADGDESDVVDRLRSDGALSVSLVAESAGVIVGHIAYSPARPEGGAAGWYALGPLAVVPAHQSRGVGSALVRAGDRALRELGAAGCTLLGDTAYYTRFGFVPTPANAPPDLPAEHFMVQILSGPAPSGPIRFHPAFGPGS